MHAYQKAFLDFAIQSKVLCFGQFTLKSGRQSPYFFNSGLFNDGQRLAELGRFYAAAIIHSGIEFDMLFGPAYKGIPLVSAMAIALADQHQRNVPFAFNRKEVKDHGEGGLIVGAPLQGRVLIIDDVISAGTSIKESMELIKHADAQAVGVVIALDRKERGEAQISAIQEIEQNYGVQVASIVDLAHMLSYMASQADLAQFVSSVRDYQQQYGVDVSQQTG